ncbi:hypothetical protein GCM10020255_076250 [Rhodococcus baikonurensis]
MPAAAHQHRRVTQHRVLASETCTNPIGMLAFGSVEHRRDQSHTGAAESFDRALEHSHCAGVRRGRRHHDQRFVTWRWVQNHLGRLPEKRADDVSVLRPVGTWHFQCRKCCDQASMRAWIQGG